MIQSWRGSVLPRRTENVLTPSLLMEPRAEGVFVPISHLMLEAAAARLTSRSILALLHFQNGLPPVLAAGDAPGGVEQPVRVFWSCSTHLAFVFFGLRLSGKVQRLVVLDVIPVQFHRSKLEAKPGLVLDRTDSVSPSLMATWADWT